VAEKKGIGVFFFIITIVAIAVGVVAIFSDRFIKKLMHGVR
jgi:hypothetical protein